MRGTLKEENQDPKNEMKESSCLSMKESPRACWEMRIKMLTYEKTFQAKCVGGL